LFLDLLEISYPLIYLARGERERKRRRERKRERERIVVLGSKGW
jgi:hypothetical protein